MDHFNKNLWEKWANNNIEFFTGLKTKSKIAIMLPQTDNLIILTKESSKVSVIINNKNTFKFPFAEIGFKFGENIVKDVLKDKEFKDFINYLNKDQIGLLSFVSENELINKGYENFLSKINYKIGKSSSCGCC